MNYNNIKNKKNLHEPHIIFVKKEMRFKIQGTHFIYFISNQEV